MHLCGHCLAEVMAAVLAYEANLLDRDNGQEGGAALIENGNYS